MKMEKIWKKLPFDIEQRIMKFRTCSCCDCPLQTDEDECLEYECSVCDRMFCEMGQEQMLLVCMTCEFSFCRTHFFVETVEETYLGECCIYAKFFTKYDIYKNKKKLKKNK